MRATATVLAIAGVALLVPSSIPSYPLDGYERTRIRRLEAYRQVQEGELPGRKVPNGALLGEADIHLRMAGVNETFERLAGHHRSGQSEVRGVAGDSNVRTGEHRQVGRNDGDLLRVGADLARPW